MPRGETLSFPPLQCRAVLCACRAARRAKAEAALVTQRVRSFSRQCGVVARGECQPGSCARRAACFAAPLQRSPNASRRQPVSCMPRPSAVHARHACTGCLRRRQRFCHCQPAITPKATAALPPLPPPSFAAGRVTADAPLSVRHAAARMFVKSPLMSAYVLKATLHVPRNATAYGIPVMSARACCRRPIILHAALVPEAM